MRLLREQSGEVNVWTREREELTAGRRKLHSEALHNSNDIKAINSVGIRRMEYVERTGDTRNAFILAWNVKERDYLEFIAVDGG
jgi:hypothetical protein